MIKSLEVNNFKCFSNIQVDLSNLNLLVGTNSAGKSTIIQSLLLAIQNMTYKKKSPLNGYLVSIGTFSEARNFITNAKEFSIRIKNVDGDTCAFSFVEDDRDGCICQISNEKALALTKILNYDNKQIHYLSEKRIGSQDVYQKNYNTYDEFGLMGEFAMDYFEKNKNLPLSNLTLLKDSSSQTLGTQVNYWLTYILNSQLSTEDIRGTDNVKAQYSNSNTRYVRPKNIGSGLSYMTSILIIGLSSQKDHIVIIENPEIHLHPRAQSRLTDFLVFLATSGIQLIIETHSDHVFNGLRKAINNKKISPEQTTINYFNIDEKTQMSKHTKVILSESGKIRNHVNGLFDQFDEDLDDLLGL